MQFGTGLRPGRPSDLRAQAGRLGVVQERLEEAIPSMRPTEDEPGLVQAQARARVLEGEAPVPIALQPTEIGWVKPRAQTLDRA